MKSKNSDRLFRILRYCIGGGAGVFLYYIILFCLTEFLGVWYLASAIIGFVVSVIVKFITHKFWTFKDNDSRETHKQVIQFIVLTICLFLGNTISLYVLVEYAGLYYLLAQFILLILLTIIGYVISAKIFKSQEMPPE